MPCAAFRSQAIFSSRPGIPLLISSKPLVARTVRRSMPCAATFAFALPKNAAAESGVDRSIAPSARGPSGISMDTQSTPSVFSSPSLRSISPSQLALSCISIELSYSACTAFLPFSPHPSALISHPLLSRLIL